MLVGGKTYQENHQPAVQRDVSEIGELVDEWNDVEEHEGAPGRLVEEQLHAVHLELPMVAPDPDGVKRRGEYTRERKDDPERRRGLYGGVTGGLRIVVRHERDAEAHRHEGVDGRAGQAGAVEDEVHEGDGRGEEDAGELIEGDRGEGEGEVGEDDVEAHCDAEGEHGEEGDAAGGEAREGGPGEHEEGEEGDEEVEAGEAELAELELRIREDGLVREDLSGTAC